MEESGDEVRSMRRGRLLATFVAVALVGTGLIGCARDGASHAPSSSPAAPSSTRPSGPSTSSVTTAPSASDTPNDQVSSSRLSQLPAFADVPWADELKAEQDRFDATPKPVSPYGRYTVPTFTGRYTNVANSERRTLRLRCDCPHRTVWLLGASSAFGLGQRDDYTVASDLVRLADEQGIDLEVRNLAVPGMTVADELDGLKAHLRHDRDQPDLVIFLDGFNDVIATYIYSLVEDGKRLDPIRFSDEWVNRYIALESPPKLEPAQIPSLARYVATSYEATRRSIASLLAKRGIPAAFFFQPDGFVSPLQSEGLAKSLNKTMAEMSTNSDVGHLLEQTAERLEPAVHNLRVPMAGFDKPVFADTTHYNETGAAFIAGKIYAAVESEIRP